MKNQIRYGKLRYLSFILLDLICLVGANLLAAQIYLDDNAIRYDFQDYSPIILYMIGIDILVTFAFDTLNLVYRRNIRKEVLRSAKHIVLSFVLLAVGLFTTKSGAD